MVKKAIVLVYSAGMSTNLLVTEMQKAAETKGTDSGTSVVSASDTDNSLTNKNVDVLLLGPQVHFMGADFERRLEPKGIPLDVINTADYGMMDGEKVLNQTVTLVGE